MNREEYTIAHDVAESESQICGSSMVFGSCTAQNFWDIIIVVLSIGPKDRKVTKGT